MIGFRVLVKVLQYVINSFLKHRQILFNNLPDLNQVNAEIIMNGDVAESGNRSPLHLRETILQLTRYTL